MPPSDYSLSDWYQRQRAPAFSSLTKYGVPVETGMPQMIGADYEQMPSQGMFAGSAVNAPITNTGGVPSTTPGFVQSLRDWGVLGTTDKNGMQQQGWGGLAFQGAQSLGNLYMGMKQYQLAKEAFEFNKANTIRNMENQAKTVNASLADRQAARVASNASAYQSVGDYMKQYQVR